ncbi:hypothetical protein BraRD5C2_67060 [Bradyrhizobium sp. RD5-C2]|nr:hypothetical protein BraRD5C2_67060 [Bradyrhizobium sp. RD5-C2]
MATTAGAASDDGYTGSIKADLHASTAVRTQPDQRKHTQQLVRARKGRCRQNYRPNALAIGVVELRSELPGSDLRHAGEGRRSRDTTVLAAAIGVDRRDRAPDRRELFAREIAALHP